MVETEAMQGRGDDSNLAAKTATASVKVVPFDRDQSNLILRRVSGSARLQELLEP